MKFEEFKLSKQLQEAIKKLGIDKPTEIQEGSIPPILEGRDLIGESATGSGKTLAFGCGILEKVNNKEGLQALVLTPTRELADQVKDMLVRLSQGKYINIIAVYGGVSLNPQFQELKRANVVVATPGRFMDHLNRRTVDTSRVKILVLDEADRMFDMGFIDDVN
ncbi:DEAD/DEAH box helicase, partial [Candidatus Woesearchaeota archaeon]|nr:DEAD/DEAH box helicase [Candidatus Woesearchaeota archaeon]